MDKETLFKEIRQGRALLWAGAGFSRYADYPMGAGVVEALYKELSNAQRQDIANQCGQDKLECPNWPLPKFAQYFIDLHHGNRTRLIEILDRIFSKEPKSIHVHEQLSKVTFIDHIVTTNYDPLFELAYRPARIHVVSQANQIPQIGNKPVNLYKIHGQPSSPESVVISEDDYNGFFNNADDVVWTHLRGLMSTRTIVFIGYAVEDPNVLSVFDGLVKKLGKLMKPAYAVGPSIDKIREERLLRNNIHFIKSTGEDFIKELWDFIQETAISELHKDGVAAVGPVSQMLSNMGLDFTMRLNGKDPIVEDIKRLDGKPIRSNVNFASDSETLNNELIKFQDLDNFEPLAIQIKDLKHFAHTVEGFKLPNDNNGILWLMRAPNWAGKVDIRLNHDLVFKDVEVHTYNKAKTVNVVALFNNCRVEIIWFEPDSNNAASYRVHYTQRYEYLASVQDLLDNALVVQNLAEGWPLELIRNGQVIWDNSKMAKPAQKKTKDYARSIMGLAKALKKIEIYFGVLFENFKFANQKMSEIKLLYNVITQKSHSTIINSRYIIHAPNPNPEELTILTNKSKHKDFGVQNKTDENHDFSVFGWIFHLSWTQKEILLSPTFKKMSGEKYSASNKGGKGMVQYLGINEKKVLLSPINQSKTPLTPEQIIREKLPQH